MNEKSSFQCIQDASQWNHQNQCCHQHQYQSIALFIISTFFIIIGNPFHHHHQLIIPARGPQTVFSESQFEKYLKLHYPRLGYSSLRYSRLGYSRLGWRCHFSSAARCAVCVGASPSLRPFQFVFSITIVHVICPILEQAPLLAEQTPLLAEQTPPLV